MLDHHHSKYPLFHPIVADLSSPLNQYLYISTDRMTLQSRANGMRTLENSSSSEEEDRTDLLGRSFQVPRPKSRSNGSIAVSGGSRIGILNKEERNLFQNNIHFFCFLRFQNQSGIYYDVDYEPSGGELYGGTTTTTATSNNGNNNASTNNIPMSTYTAGRVPQSYYMK